MKNLSKHQYLGKIPESYNEFYNVSFFGTDRIFYKPLKVTYNNEHEFYIYRPSVKYFLEEFASKYSKEEKKEVYNSISQGYNIGAKEYNNIFDLTETGAKRLLNELERLQKIPFKETHVNFAELKKCGEIEGRINCIYGIMDSNSDLFITDETINSLSFSDFIENNFKHKTSKIIRYLKQKHFQNARELMIVLTIFNEYNIVYTSEFSANKTKVTKAINELLNKNYTRQQLFNNTYDKKDALLPDFIYETYYDKCLYEIQDLIK